MRPASKSNQRPWWFAFGLLAQQPRKEQAIKDLPERSLRLFFDGTVVARGLRTASPRYARECQRTIELLSKFLGHEALLDDLGDGLLDRFNAWQRQSYASGTTIDRWGMIRRIWREAHALSLVSVPPCIRRRDTSVVWLVNYARPERALRAFFVSVHWPRRSAFVSAGGKKDYWSAINALCAFRGCEVTLDQLSEDLIEQFAAWRVAQGRSASTINKNVAMLAALWRFAFKKRFLDDLPRDLVDIEELTRVPEAWTVDRFATILNAAASFDGTILLAPVSHFFPALLLTLYDTGLRIGAVLKLTVDALDGPWLNVPAEVQKHKSGQILLLDPRTAELLRTLPRGESRMLFPTDGWRKHALIGLERMYRRILKKGGLPHGRRDLFHKLRRTNASYVAAAAGEQAAQKQLGHSHISLTRRNYIDPRLLKLDQNAAALIPRPHWSGGEEDGAIAATPAIQIQDRPAATGMAPRAARGAHERGFSNPK
jgi:integrase